MSETYNDNGMLVGKATSYYCDRTIKQIDCYAGGQVYKCLKYDQSGVLLAEDIIVAFDQPNA